MHTSRARHTSIMHAYVLCAQIYLKPAAKRESFVPAFGEGLQTRDCRNQEGKRCAGEGEGTTLLCLLLLETCLIFRAL